MMPLSSMNGSGWMLKIYFGIPKRVCKLFSRITVSSKILVAGILGIPLLAMVSMAAYTDFYHSILPLRMLIAGAVQFAIETDPTCSSSVPPTLVEAIHRLTPEQLDMSEALFRGSLFVATLYIALVIWSLFKACRFVVRRLRCDQGKRDAADSRTSP